MTRFYHVACGGFFRIYKYNLNRESGEIYLGSRKTHLGKNVRFDKKNIAPDRYSPAGPTFLSCLSLSLSDSYLNGSRFKSKRAAKRERRNVFYLALLFEFDEHSLTISLLSFIFTFVSGGTNLSKNVRRRQHSSSRLISC